MDEEMIEQTEFKNEAASEVFKNEAAPEEKFEEREARLKREDYLRRNLEAMDEYERITGQPHPSRQDPEAAVRQRCCF
jgi:hypothetical protein